MFIVYETHFKCKLNCRILFDVLIKIYGSHLGAGMLAEGETSLLKTFCHKSVILCAGKISVYMRF